MARKILLADDSVTAQNMGRKILADAGYEVIAVNNGSAALKKVADQRPDLIVLDVYMPGYSGLEVCQRLKETGETARIPILLTVGKLEPFKPEEAKRVRADGFIVKPFEASELLSALTKLEDKIVPYSEGSKPGRFARTIAAVEEGRYEKADGNEEAGWKSRISFPSKKKDKAAEKEESDDSAIYNPVNKDLRTVVDRKPSEGSKGTSAEDARVDLGALAPEGLPKDVTPEEIAALAAAAARVTGATDEGKVESENKTVSKMAEPAAATSEPEVAKAVKVESQIEVKAEAKSDATPEVNRGTKLEPAPETKAETKSEAKPESIASKPSGESGREIAAATFAGSEPEGSKSLSISERLLQPSPAEVAAAFVQTSDTKPETNAASDKRDVPAEEPVTMAVGAGVGTGRVSSSRSRWTAVGVTLTPEETTISLEHEMQRSSGGFAAAEASQSSPAAPETIAPAPTPTERLSAEISAEPSALASQIPASSTSVVEAAIAAVASAASGAVNAAVREFEKVVGNVEPARLDQTESRQTELVQSEANPEQSLVVGKAVTAPAAVENAPYESKTVPYEQKHDVAPVAASSAEDAAEEKVDQPLSVAPVSVAPANPVETSAEVISAISIPAVPLPAAIAAEVEKASVTGPRGGTDDMAKKESELTENTAAAWASWRRIRDVGDSKGESSNKQAAEKDEESNGSSSRDLAAMAVAAGAERRPDEASSADSDSGEIASIVDSVLADLRPKIVEEISRKLGKKK